MLADRRLRIRDVRMGPDGSVYVLSDSGGTSITVSPPATGQLIRLTPKR
jgi:glucose/arabinose dehydrogenase